MQRHRHQEFIRFLNAIEAQVPAGKLIHAIVDNYATHKHPKVRAWLARHPRWTFHFTPTSASWLNAVEGFFANLTETAPETRRLPLRRRLAGRHQSLLAETNADPKPFVWTADLVRALVPIRFQPTGRKLEPSRAGSAGPAIARVKVEIRVARSRVLGTRKAQVLRAGAAQ